MYAKIRHNVNGFFIRQLINVLPFILKRASKLDEYSRELGEIMDDEWKAGRWMNFFPSPDIVTRKK